MKHDIPFELLSEYIDNRCSTQDTARVETHLSECPECRKVVIMLKNADSAIRHLGRVETTEALDREFNRKLRERVKSREEDKLGYLFRNAAERIRDIAAIPRPALAAVCTTILLFILTYDVLTYSLVRPPVMATVEGDVSVYSETRKTWLEARPGLKLARGDIVTVGAGSRADIDQPGKYIVRVKDNSTVVLAKLLPKYINGTTVYNITRGKALVSIAEDFKGSKFVVNTPEAAATALGTEFLVDVSARPVDSTRLGVLEGMVRVESTFVPKAGARSSRRVMVGGGEATEVYRNATPLKPRQLLDKEWAEMAEFYGIGAKSQVALLISNGKYRTRELLRPCPIFISGLKPRELSESLREAITIIDDAIKTKDRAKHLDGIKRLEGIADSHKDPSYAPQLLLFIGSYYNYLDMPDEAVAAFLKAADGYPASTFASMGLYAAGIVCGEKLHDNNRARYYYDLVVRRYPAGQEAKLIVEIREKIAR